MTGSAGTINVGEVYKALGRLEEAMENVVEDVKDIKESQDEARISRDTMANQMASIMGRMNSFETKLQDASDITEEVKQWKQRGIGALFIVGIGSSAMTWVVMNFWAGIAEALRAKIG